MSRRLYTLEEDQAIYSYVLGRGPLVRGNQIWKQAELKKVCPNRTWHSMRSRYLKHLKPKLYEKKGRLPPRARKQQTEYESSSDEDTGPWNEFLSSDEDDDVEEEDSEADNSEREEAGFDRPSSSSSEVSEEDEDLDSSGDNLNNIVSKLNTAGLTEQLEMIQSKLRRTADERENKDKEQWQPRTIITIKEEDREAMANKLFEKALMKVGLEQKTFWRIPINLNPEKLRRAAKGLEGSGVSESDEDDDAEFRSPPVSNKRKSRKDVLSMLVAARKKSGSASRREREKKRSGGSERALIEDISDNGNSNDNRTARERDMDVSVPSQSSKTSHRRVKTLEESDEEDEVKIQEKGSKKASSTSNADNKTNSVSDSNDDNRNISDDEDLNNDVERSGGGKKRPRDEDDDDSSDDDEEFNRALNSNPKRIKRALYLKDDEDD